MIFQEIVSGSDKYWRN